MPDDVARPFEHHNVDELKVNLYPSVGIKPGYAVGSTQRIQIVAENGDVVAQKAKADLDAFPDQREAMTKINHQLDRLVPSILTGAQRPTSIAPQNCDAHVRAFMNDGVCFVLVTNPGRVPVDARIGVLGVDDQEGRDLHSDTTVALDSGYFDLNLKPLDVFVLAFGL